MPLQSSGQISLSDIFAERNGTLPSANMNVSLTNVSEDRNTDPCNVSSVDGNPPHRLEEFYNYDHNCGGSSCNPVEISGPFGDFTEACEAGPGLPCDVVYVTSEAVAVGDTVYEDPGCSSPFPGGSLWYYNCTSGTTAIQINDGGVIQGVSTCGSGGKK